MHFGGQQTKNKAFWMSMSENRIWGGGNILNWSNFKIIIRNVPEDRIVIPLIIVDNLHYNLCHSVITS